MNIEQLKLVIDLVSKLGADAKLVIILLASKDLLMTAMILVATLFVIIKVVGMLCRANSAVVSIEMASGFHCPFTARELQEITAWIRKGRGEGVQ